MTASFFIGLGIGAALILAICIFTAGFVAGSMSGGDFE